MSTDATGTGDHGDDWPGEAGAPRPPEQERRADDRRAPPDRRSTGRRSSDASGPRGAAQTVWVVAWAVVGAVLVLYLFLLAIGAVSADEAKTASVVALVLAVLWFAHAWRRVLGGGVTPPGDRERRGF